MPHLGLQRVDVNSGITIEKRFPVPTEEWHLPISIAQTGNGLLVQELFIPRCRGEISDRPQIQGRLVLLSQDFDIKQIIEVVPNIRTDFNERLKVVISDDGGFISVFHTESELTQGSLQVGTIVSKTDSVGRILWQYNLDGFPRFLDMAEDGGIMVLSTHPVNQQQLWKLTKIPASGP